MVVDLRELKQEDAGGFGYLHLPTVVEDVYGVLNGTDVQAVLVEEVGMHPSQIGVFEEKAFRIMEVATAWACRVVPQAHPDAWLAIGQALGELTGGDAAMGPPPGRKGRKVYDEVYALVEGWNGPTATPEVTRAILAEVVKRYG